MRIALLAPLLVALAACGGGAASPQSVVRAWSEAVNTGDNEGAARLFADGARIVQGNEVRRLDSFAEARAWNSSLPCSGRILSLIAREDTVRVTFVLGDRPQKECDGPGERALALFRVHDGKIVLWHQLEPSLQPPEQPV